MNETKTGSNVPEQPTVPPIPRMVPTPPRQEQPQVVIHAHNCAFNIWQTTGEEDHEQKGMDG